MQLTNELTPAATNDSDLKTQHDDAEAVAEETRTNEELDTEVSQINTQSNNKTQSSEPAESFSRPMSRTSSMTPVIKNSFVFTSLYIFDIYILYTRMACPVCLLITPIFKVAKSRNY